MEMIQEAHQSSRASLPSATLDASSCISSATPPPATTSAPGQTTIVPRTRRTPPLTRFVPYRPVFQTSPATLAQHTRYCHHHWFNQLGPDSPQSWLGKKHVSHPAQMSRAITAGSVEKHIAYHSRTQTLAWQKHGVWLLLTVCVLVC